MKNLFYFLCGCTLSMAACSKSTVNEETLPNLNGKGCKFYASFNDEQSRTILNEQMKNVWCEDDRISIFMGNTYNHHYKFDGATGDTKGTFSKVDDRFITGETLSANYAIYPYAEDNCIDDNGTMYSFLSATQNYQENSFGLNTNPMVAVTENVDNRFLCFQNVCGYIRVKLYGENVTLKSVTLTGNNEEILAGAMQITALYGQVPQLTMHEAKDKTLTIDCGDGIKIGTTEYGATSFVFVVPPMIMKKGFSIVATDINDRTFTKVSDQLQEVKRNTILSMPKLKWVDDNPPKFEIPDGVLTIHNAEKGMLLATISDYAYDKIVSLKITGTMNDEDFLCIYYEMPALRYLDISDVDITTLPNRSFYQSSTVETIILPNTLQKISDEVFFESVIKEVHFNEGLTTIGSYAFKNCHNLTTIDIPQSVKTIGAYAFYDCNNVTNMSFADNCQLSALNNYVFYNTLIESIHIPANVASISKTAFSSCKQLKTVTFEKDSKLTVMDQYFKDTSLESIEIPKNVNTISANAFKNMDTLKNIYFEPDSKLQTIEANAFYDCDSITNIIIPASCVDIYYGAFYSCSGLTDVKFESQSQLTSIGTDVDPNVCWDSYGKCWTGRETLGVFESTPIQSIEIPASVQIICARAFLACWKLQKVTFENNSQLQIIQGGYGKEHYALSSVFDILCLNGAFGGCRSLTELIIPRSVQQIGIAAFRYSGIESLAFEPDSQLLSIEGEFISLPDNSDPKYAYAGAFSELSHLTTVTLPRSVTNIGTAAFASCENLQKLTFEDNSNLSTIGSKAFQGCNLSSITFPASLEVIKSDCFRDNTNLTMINFQEGSLLNKIEDCAFMDCGVIHYFYAQNVTQLKSIGTQVFSGCDDMRLFKLGTASCPKAYYNSFGEIGVYSVLKVPTESVDSYKAATGWKNFASITGLDE